MYTLSSIKAEKLKSIISLAVLILTSVLAFVSRLFSNITNEPIIHEYDPHFNWRCAQYIYENGIYEFFGWYDNISWYPQGRPVGETTYPGLMFTSAIIKWALEHIHINISLLQVCVHMGPLFSIFSVLVAYAFGTMLCDSSVGLLSCLITSFIPGMMARSVAGAYDYECVSLFILVFCIYTFMCALKNGSIFMSTLSGFVYGYMALTWGGYVFISNCIPLYVATMIIIGRYSFRLHITYSLWSLVGTLLSAQIPFIGDKIFHKPEHFAIIFVFIGIQIWGFFTFISKHLSANSFTTLWISSSLVVPIFFLFVITVGASTGLLGGFSGRLLQMFDPSYASKNIPIIASVAEHQQSTWSSFYVDLGGLMLFIPIGFYYAVLMNSEASYMILICGMSTLWFASIMVRLVLVFTPSGVFAAAIGIDSILRVTFRNKGGRANLISVTVFVFLLLTLYGSIWFDCFSYSHDHIHFDVLTSQGRASSDDYREGYRWLWSNTHRDDIVMSWWDYGYQITSMGGRACIADGNTNNFTHIGIIGMTMSSPEKVSWRLARLLDVNYMLVIFGGASAYDGDDINKFLWMPKIANQTFTNISGDMYLQGYTGIIGNAQTNNMTNSMLFKFCYHNFIRFRIHPQVQPGFDISRSVQITKGLTFKLNLFEEAYTTKYWVVRLYRVHPDPKWDRVY